MVCMKKTLIIFAILVVSGAAPSVSAISTPDITFIPSRVSVNSSLVMIVDPHPSPDESVRINWVLDTGEDFGSVPNVNGVFLCYFSSTDPSANCGPSPFRYEGTYKFDNISIKNQYGDIIQVPAMIEAGNIYLDTEIERSGNYVNITVYPTGGGATDSVYYRLYTQSGEPLAGKEGYLKKDRNAYLADLTLEDGEYFLSLEANSSTGFGGTVIRLSAGGSQQGSYAETLEIDKVVWSTIVERGGSREKAGLRIRNLGTSAIENLTVSVPKELSSMVSIILSEDSVNASDTIYYSFSVRNIDDSAHFQFSADLLSGSRKIGEIPVDVYVSVTNGSSQDMTCENKGDMEYCYGGICCDGDCKRKANCCTDDDCNGGTCKNYVCVPSTSTQKGCTSDSDCSSGKVCNIYGECVDCVVDKDCNTGETCKNYVCVPSTSTQKGCTSDSECSPQVCDTDSGECVECVKDSDCDEDRGEVCVSNSCVVKEPESPDTTLTLVLIIAIAALGGIAAYYYFAKMKKKPEEYGSEEESFDEDEFY